MPKKLLNLFLSLVLSSGAFHVNAKEYQHDTRAAEIADATVEAMGGRESYDKLRFISWNFFGKRFHVWDKYTGDIRIEFGDNFSDVLIMNIHTKQGKWWQQGQAVTDKALLTDKLNWAYRIWINDSYWVVMPFKLHDPGVNLAFSRQDTSLKGKAVDVLTMTFNDVGVTPDNKYELFIDKQTHLIAEFAFYPTVDSAEPRFRRPWANYQAFEGALLADSRGDSGMAPINAYMQIGAEVMSSNGPAVDAAGNLIPKIR